jgi:hypothetical protein
MYSRTFDGAGADGCPAKSSATISSTGETGMRFFRGIVEQGNLNLIWGFGRGSRFFCMRALSEIRVGVEFVSMSGSPWARALSGFRVGVEFSSARSPTAHGTAEDDADLSRRTKHLEEGTGMEGRRPHPAPSGWAPHQRQRSRPPPAAPAASRPCRPSPAAPAASRLCRPPPAAS